MTGQSGAGNVAIPTLAFSSLAAFVTEATKRSLGTNDLNAIRVQPHTIYIGEATCYEIMVTAFDDQQGCILVLRYQVGCYPAQDPMTPGESRAKTAHLSIKKTIEDLAHMTTAMGEWVHDPVPSDMWHSWGDDGKAE